MKHKTNIPVILINSGGDIKRKTDVARTLLSRDYKGTNNYGFNGVVEIEEQDTDSCHSNKLWQGNQKTI